MIGTHIKKVTTENTGGGCMVDFIHLPDGRVIGVNEDCIVLYNSMRDFELGESDNPPSINLYKA